MGTESLPPARSETRRPVFVETGLTLAVLFSVLFFGATPAWASMSVCAILFAVLFLNPDAVSRYTSLPVFFRTGLAAVFAYVSLQASGLPGLGRAEAGEWLKWAAFGSAFLLIQKLDAKGIFRLMGALVIIGLTGVLYGFCQTVTGAERVLWVEKVFHRGCLTGFYLNRNHMAGLLELCLGLLAGLWLDAWDKRKSKTYVILGACFAVLFAGLIRTGSRAGTAAFAAGMVLIIGMCFFRGRRLTWGAVWMVVAAGLVLAGTFGTDFWERWEELEDGGRAWGGRLEVWRDSLLLIRDHVWTGSGLGSFARIFPSYQSEGLPLGWNHAHNDYVELAAGLGLPVFTVLVCAWGLLFSHLIRRAKTPPALGGIAALGAMTVHGLTDFNFAVPANAMLFVFVAAMSVRLTVLQGEGSALRK